MLTRNTIVLSILLILFTSSFTPFTYASIESEAQEDLLAGCRDGQTLVHRSLHLDFVCVDPSTAKRWVELGLAEIVQKSLNPDEKESSSFEEKTKSKKELESSILPPITPTTSTKNNSECREGYVLVYRFAHHDTFCISKSTAIAWERLGLSETVDNVSQKDESLVKVSDKTSSEEHISEEHISEEHISEEHISEEHISEEHISEEHISEDLENNESEDTLEFPQIIQIEKGVWAITDADNTSSILIEGNDGIIAINSLNSYKSTKMMIEQFKIISDKKIKAVVLTMINPEILFALNAHYENNKDVKIIIDQEFLETYEDDYDIIVKNSIPFSSKIDLNIIGVKIELVIGVGLDSDHTYVFLPEIGGVIVGDSTFGVFPTVLHLEYLTDLRD